MSSNKKMESLELSPINQENYSDLEIICKLIEDILNKYCSEAMAFTAIDINNEEKIGISEFTSELQNNFNIDDPDKIQLLFDMFDQDKDGQISIRDWEQSFQEYPLKLVHIEQNSTSQHSELNQIEADGNQLRQSLGGTPYRSQNSLNYRHNHSPSLNLAEIQAKLNNSPGLDGLMRKCNALKIQSHTQNAAISSQFYQNHIDSGSELRQSLFASSNMLPSNFLKVEDDKVKQIFGDFKTPSKELSKQQSVTDLENNEKQQLQNEENQENQKNIVQNQISESKERLSVPYDARLILSQKIVSPIIGRKQSYSKEIEDNFEIRQSPERNEQGLPSQYNNPLFFKSDNKGFELYENRMQRILQSSSPIEQYKNHNNGSSNQLNYQIGFSNLKWEIQKQQQEIKPKKDYKNNFQSYLSLIGLGQNRSNHHHGQSATTNQLYYTTKPAAAPAQNNQNQSKNNTNRIQQLYRVSSTERSSFRNTPNSQIPFSSNHNNNQNLQQTKQRRGGLEGIIDKINIKKDSIFSKKGNQASSSILNQHNALLSTNQINTNQSNISNNTSNLMKLNRITPNSHLSSKQADIDGSLEKIRLISMQRNINYAQNATKENELKLSPYQQLKSTQQQQQLILNQPLSQPISSLRNTQVNYFPQLASSSMGVGYKQNNQQQHMNQGERLSSPIQPLSSSKGFTSSLGLKQAEIRIQPVESILSQQITQLKKVDQEEQKQRIEFNKETVEITNQNQAILTPDAFEDYDGK